MRLIPCVFLLSLLAVTWEAKGKCVDDSCADRSCASRGPSAVAAEGVEEDDPIAVSLMQLSGSTGVSLRASSSLRGDGLDAGVQGPTAPDQDPVHVAYIAKQKMFNATLRSMLTLGVHNSAPNLTIHLLVPPGEEGLAESIKQCLLQQLGLVSDLRGGIPEVEISPLTTRPPHLFKIQDYVPEVPRIIFLDSNTLVLRDISELYGRQTNRSLAAALSSNLHPVRFGRFCQGDCTNASHLAFNDGVMLLDLDRWKLENIAASLIELTLTTPEDYGSNQMLLNIEFQGCRDGYDVLPQTWDTFVSTGMLGQQDIRDVIADFVQDPKPWNMGNSSRDDFFRQFRPFWAPGGVAPVDDCAGFEL